MRANLVQFSSYFLKSKKLNLSLTCIAAALLIIALPLQKSAIAKNPKIEAKVLTHILGKWKTPKGDIIGFVLGVRQHKARSGFFFRLISGKRRHRFAVSLLSVAKLRLRL